MSRYVNAVTVTVLGLLAAGALGFAYETDRVSAGTLVFLGALVLALGVVAGIFLRKLSHPDVSLGQMLYKTDHPTRT